MAVFKLTTGKVVVQEGGITQVLTPPCGVSYNADQERWGACVLNDEGNWRTKSFSVKKHGILGGFEEAVEAREESLNFLLNRRMLPRIRRAYVILERNNLYVVRDPLEKNYRSFSTKEHAQAFNVQVTKDWIYKYTFDVKTMIEVTPTAKYNATSLMMRAS